MLAAACVCWSLVLAQRLFRRQLQGIGEPPTWALTYTSGAAACIVGCELAAVLYSRVQLSEACTYSLQASHWVAPPASHTHVHSQLSLKYTLSAPLHHLQCFDI